jgi:acetyl esterase/lipase
MSRRERMDPELVEGLDGFIAATGPRGLAGIADPVERRRTFLALMEAGDEEPDARVATEDLHVPGPDGAPEVRVRLYRPIGLDGPLPALFYIHGGGMVIGAIESEDAIVRARCLDLGCAAVSVDYRLAPEHPATRSKTSASSTAGPAARASRRCSASAPAPTPSTTTPPRPAASTSPGCRRPGSTSVRDESIDYARRLLGAGVPTELHTTAGCFHASEVFVPEAESSGRIVAARVEALRRAFR